LGIFIVFAAGRGGFSSRKLTMDEYLPASNQKLSLLRTPTRIVDFHHATGNFVVRTPKVNRAEIADELSLVFGVPCAILQSSQVLSCLSIAEKVADPSVQPGIRWTKGIAFKVKGRPCTIDLKPTTRAQFFRISEYAVGVFKKDQVATNEASGEGRAGGWGAVSADISNALGGIWTVRPLTRIQGVIEKALKYEPSMPFRN
jgi:hypothetical protein